MPKHNTPNRPTSFPIQKLVPNLVTIIGLCMGLFGLKYAISMDWEKAVLFIVVAAFIDGMDGRLARLLNASSPIGAQLDSLADFFNFSIAPALILYLWKTHEIKAFGWMIALFFIICGALRLARFNVIAEDEEEDNNVPKGSFFTGVPAPVAAGLSLLPMIITFMVAEEFPGTQFAFSPLAVIAYMAIIATLMVSNIPTLSVKNITIKRKYAALAMAFATLFIIMLIIKPWITLPLMGLGYMLWVPAGWVVYFRLKRSA